MAAAAEYKDYYDNPVNVHIPPCDDKACREKLSHLAERLRQVGIRCEFKYKPNGLYKTWYDKFITRCSYTILHICPRFFTKMIQVLEISELKTYSFADKIVCIRFNDSAIEKEESNRSAEMRCEEYFCHFHQWDVCSESALSEFVNDVQSLLEGETAVGAVKSSVGVHDAPLHLPQAAEKPICYEKLNDTYDRGSPTYSDLYNYQATLKKPDNMQMRETTRPENKPSMGAISDMFGQTQGQDVFARIECPQDEHCELLSLTSLEKLEEFRRLLEDQQLERASLATQNFILKQVIPELYRRKNILALAYVAVCSQQVLQNHALVMLELLVLEGHAAKEKRNLKKTEQLLEQALQQMRYSSKELEGHLSTYQSMCNLLLMLRYEIAIHCQLDTDLRSGRRSLRIRFPIRTSTSNIFQTATPQQLTEAVKEFSGPSIKSALQQQARKLIDRSMSSQIAVIFEYLKKVFSAMEVKALEFLREYVSSKKSPPTECLTMIVNGLTLFLCHGLRGASDRNIQVICTAVMSVLNSTSEKEFPNKAKLMLHSLVFDKTPVIRRGIVDYFKKRNLHYSDFEQLLLPEITRLLCPLLTVDGWKRQKDNAKWQTTHGTFNHSPVIVIFHTPEELKHWDKNERQLINFADRMHIEQVKKLLTLQHEHIITMFAYQVECMPLFYILEDYMTNNLQTALKNRNDNRRYFDQPRLMKFLTGALEALDYCHNKEIIHRNLTADSLFIVGGYEVKLCGFTLAFPLDGFEERIVVDGCSQIPTRWSAQESVSIFKFSKASDVYMFGHLIYEVLTHGALPYSHINVSNTSFVEQIKTQQIQLCREACISKEMYGEICRCVAFNPRNRPDTSTLQETLLVLCKSTSANYKPRYPSLSVLPSENTRQPSTTFGKGTPEYDDVRSEHQYVRPIYMSFAQGLTKQQMGDGYFFQEQVTRKISQQMLDQLNGESKYIFPPCMRISRVEDANEEKYCIGYYIPSLNVYKLMTFVSQRKLGDDLCNYLTLLLNIAETIEQLHSASFVLGDIGTSSVFVELENNQAKVHIVSWAYFNYIQTFSDKAHQLCIPSEGPVFERAAPEVKDSGLYSPASDVYCFGRFLKEILHAFNMQTTGTQFDTGDTSEYEIYEFIYEDLDQAPIKSQPVTHPKCSKLLMEIADQCTVFDRDRRLTLASVIQKIKSFSAQARPRSGNQENSWDSETTLKKTFHSNSETTVMKAFHSNSETTVMKAFPSDSDSEVMPKCLHQRRSSTDSAFHSFCESDTFCKELVFPIQQQNSKVMSYVGADDVNCHDSMDKSLQDAYVDATSSPAHLTEDYTNVPMPKRVNADDLEPIYSEPEQIPLGYRYLESGAPCLHSHYETVTLALDASSYVPDTHHTYQEIDVITPKDVVEEDEEIYV